MVFCIPPKSRKYIPKHWRATIRKLLSGAIYMAWGGAGDRSHSLGIPGAATVAPLHADFGVSLRWVQCTSPSPWAWFNLPPLWGGTDEFPWEGQVSNGFLSKIGWFFTCKNKNMTKFESSGSTEHPSNLDLSHLVAPEHAASRVRCFNNTIDG